MLFFYAVNSLYLSVARGEKSTRKLQVRVFLQYRTLNYPRALSLPGYLAVPLLIPAKTHNLPAWLSAPPRWVLTSSLCREGASVAEVLHGCFEGLPEHPTDLPIQGPLLPTSFWWGKGSGQCRYNFLARLNSCGRYQPHALPSTQTHCLCRIFTHCLQLWAEQGVLH